MSKSSPVVYCSLIGLIAVQLVTNTLLHVNVTFLGERNTASNVAVITMTTMMNTNVTTIKQLEITTAQVTWPRCNTTHVLLGFSLRSLYGINATNSSCWPFKVITTIWVLKCSANTFWYFSCTATRWTHIRSSSKVKCTALTSYWRITDVSVMR